MAYDIILLNGLPQSSDEVSFNAQTYHFTNADGADITDLIPRMDKINLVPGFDISKDNSRLSREAPARVASGVQAASSQIGPVPDLPTNVSGLFWSGVGTTLTNIGTEAGRTASGVGQGIKDTLQTVVIFGIAGLVVYMLISGKKL